MNKTITNETSPNITSGKKRRTDRCISDLFIERARSRVRYWQRITRAYLLNSENSNLSFWHTVPKLNPKLNVNELKNYYMDYSSKTGYPGPFDSNGVPMLNYFGETGIQYNPDAIGQYALGHYEIYLHNGGNKHLEVFLSQADWFQNNLQERDKGIGVWVYNFDFEYFRTLKKPWYTSLGQGHGISVLLRAYQLTNRKDYLGAARKAFLAFRHTTDIDGGVKYIDDNGYLWFEEAIVSPCTHILNGFIWALWGLYDYWLVTKDKEAFDYFNEGIRTLESNLHKFDNGFWSTYDLAKTLLPGIASLYYHSLHIVQLRALHRITNEKFLKDFADKWENYKKRRLNRYLALSWKAVFKVLYY